MQRSTEHHQRTLPPSRADRGHGEPPHDARWLRDELLRLSRRVRWLVWIRAVALLIVSVFAVLAVGVLLDWWWRPVSLWGRGTIIGLVVVGIAAAAGWFIWTVWAHPITPMSVARRLERVVPALGDRLSSALALIEQSDQRPAGSAELATTAVARVAEEFGRSDAEKRIDRGPTLRMVATAALVLTALLVSYFWNPAVASLAARRMVDLRSESQWPRQHELVLVDLPERMHAGEMLEIFVANRLGPLPEDTEVQLRFADGGRRDEPVGMAGEFGRVTLSEVRQSLEVRARGGDDDTMPWQAVEVLDAPRVLEHRLRLRPPEYTGRPEIELSDTRLRVLAGTRLQFTATVSRPLRSASLRLRSAGEAEPLDELALQLTPRGETEGEDASTGAVRLVLRNGPLVLNQSLRARIAWRDEAGLAGESLWELDIRVDPDAPPQLRWLEPESDSVITPRSSLSLRAAAEDDLGLTESWFEARLVSASLLAELDRQRLDKRPPRASLESGGAVSGWFTSTAENEDVAIKPGDTLELRAVAIDVAGQRGESALRRLRVISQSELARQIDQLRSEAVDRLREARGQQAAALEQSQAAGNRLGAGAEPQRAAADRLRASMSAQQATSRALVGDPESAGEVLGRAAELAAAGGLATEEMQPLINQIEAVAADQVAPAAAALERAAENLVRGQREAAGSQLETATAAQREADRQLDALVESLLREDRQRALDNELTELAADQQRTRSQTRRLDQATQRDAERRRLGDRQRELARRSEQLAEQLEMLAEQLRDDDPVGSRSARGAAEALRGATPPNDGPRPPVAEAMRRAAEALDREQLGRAETLQDEVQRRVEAAREALAGREPGTTPPPGENPRQAEQQREALAAGVRELHGRQQALLEDWEATPPAELADRQADIAERIGGLVAQEQAPPGFADVLGDAADDMQVATQWLRRGNRAAVARDPATAAEQRLQLVINSLQNDPSGESSQADAADSDPPEDADAGEPPPIPRESLRLAREVQSFLKARTVALADQLEAASGPGGDPAERARLRGTLRKLAAEQQRLVERIERYARQSLQSESATSSGTSP